MGAEVIRFLRSHLMYVRRVAVLVMTIVEVVVVAKTCYVNVDEDSPMGVLNLVVVVVEIDFESLVKMIVEVVVV